MSSAQHNTSKPRTRRRIRARDGWALFFAAIFIVLCVLPLVPRVQLNNLNIILFQIDARTQYISPPEATVYGDPFYWQYALAYRSVCRVFIVYDGKDLETALEACTVMNIGYTVNITDWAIRDNPNVTTGRDWDYVRTLSQVQFQRPTALYLVGLVLGLAGILTTLIRIFTEWNVVIGDAALKFGSVIFLIASVSLAQVVGNPSHAFLGLAWTAIILMFYILSVAVVDLWHHWRHGRPNTAGQETALH